MSFWVVVDLQVMSVHEVAVSRVGVIAHVGTSFSEITESRKYQPIGCVDEFSLVYFVHICTYLTLHALLGQECWF
jgi:hypothetical protein